MILPSSPSLTRQSRPYQGGFIIGLVIFIVVAARALIRNYGYLSLLPSFELLGAFGLLYILEPLLSRRLRWVRFIYYPLQTVLVLTLSYLSPFLDVYNLLYAPLALQALHSFSLRAATAWLAAYPVLILVSNVRGVGWTEGMAVSLLMIVAGIFILSYDQIYLRTATDQAESQALLVDLQNAHQKLKDYAAQAEELAAARERNRLARELHDSISQVIFSITLNSQATRMLLERDPSRIPEQLDRLQELTSSALIQLRALIAQLRPPQNQS